ncbi:Hypothetical predicted protein [Lecanosticta acicola]|uniref:Heterokaryon incompatibility domain-containing protein n=1 Tax=Lecanosticta acicola TaxID=111012 RepID=A0AAI8YRL8_9PEZI|nr:Hypothetical predicted protein [Lecanosticta acicola]
MARAFNYGSLDSSKKYIRLLRACEGPTQTLTFNIETVSLEQDPLPDYYAISYFWGDANTKKVLRVDKNQLEVPENAERALRAVIAHGFSCPENENVPKSLQSWPALWIDAVCINQINSKERSVQVAFMRDIYAKAKETFVWLGDAASQESAAAVSSVCSLFKICKSSFDGESSSTGYSDDPFETALATCNWHANFDGESSSTGCTEDSFETAVATCDWRAISGIYNSTWWRRIWTVQEGLLARKATCIFGSHVILFHELTRLAYALSQRHYYHTPEHLRRLSDGLELATSRLRLETQIRSRGITMLDLVKQAENLSATNPRDMVYGMLGCFQAPQPGLEHRTSLKIDYESPVEEVYARATVKCIQDTASLEVLQLAALRPRKSESASFPSWSIPLPTSFPQEPHPRPIRSQIDTSDPHFYEADCILEVPSSTNWKTLRLSGFTYDRVESVILFEGIWPDLDSSEFRAKIEDIRHLVQRRTTAQRTLTPGSCFNTESSHNANVASDAIAGPSISDNTASNSSDSPCSNSTSITDVATAADKMSPEVAEAIASALAAAIYTCDGTAHTQLVSSLRQFIFLASNRRRIFVRKLMSYAFDYSKRMKRAFFITKQGRFGVALPATVEGDAVCVLDGGPVPFILRRHEDREHWALVSDAHLDGVEEFVSATAIRQE